MKKVLFYIFFLLVIMILLMVPLYSGNMEGLRSSFVVITLISIIVTIYKGYVAGLIALSVGIVIVGQVFHPTDEPFSFQPDTVLMMSQYIIQGVIINFFIYILKQAQEREQQLREKFQLIISSIGDAVIATDRSGQITYMNARAQKLTGWSYHNARKLQIDEVMVFEDADTAGAFKETVEKVMTEGKRTLYANATNIVSKDHNKIAIDDSIAPLKDSFGKTIGAVIIFRDISEHKHHEEQRELLLSSVSHELKNYITSIQGYSSIIEKKLGKSQDKQLYTYSRKLTQKIQTMTTMITGMFDLSKLKMGKLDMKRKEFNLFKLVKTIVQDIELDEKKRIKLDGEDHVMVFADPVRIGQVMTNLLTNAIKYSNSGENISVKIRTRDNAVEVQVSDKGEGIPQDQLEKIFRPFYRALGEEERVTISGSGLGLYISREIVRQHGGRMWATSKKGEGSHFFFTLPYESAEDVFIPSHGEEGLIVRIKEILALHE